MVITNGGADLTYQPAADYCNDGSPTDDFTYTLNGGSTATVAMTVTCVDDDPTANDDTATVAEDSSNNSILVLGNDSNADGGPLNVTGVTQPANGTAAFTAGGVTYTPDANYCNDGSPTDDFTYTINGGSTATVSVTVTCEDDAPTAVDDTATVVEDSSNNSILVLGNDTDTDGGPLNVTGVTQPGNGTAAFTAGGVTYTPDANYCNDGSPTDDFTYTINGGSSATVSVTVTCVDDDPVAVDDTATVVEDSSNNTILVLGNDTDIDAGPLNVTGVTQPANGVAGFTAGSVTYSPVANYCNDGVTTDDFTYTINGGSSATVAVTVTCVDDAPVAVADSYTILEDAATTAFDVLDNDGDVDGDPLSIGAVGAAANGSAVINGAVIDYTPNADHCGADAFTYTINGGNTVTVDVTITCVNDQPDFALNDVVYVDVDQIGSIGPQVVACQFDFGPDDEDLSQAVADFLVNVTADDDNILSAVDVANDGQLSHSFTGNTGEASIDVQLQDDGGTEQWRCGYIHLQNSDHQGCRLHSMWMVLNPKPVRVIDPGGSIKKRAAC